MPPALTTPSQSSSSWAICSTSGHIRPTSGHHNLIGQNTGAGTSGCAGFTNGTNGNLVGTAATPIDPTLGPLANNGGPTLTRALLSGSPAINNGDATDCQTTPVNNLDQRHQSRHATTRLTCDIGAYDTGGAGS